MLDEVHTLVINDFCVSKRYWRDHVREVTWSLENGRGVWKGMENAV